MTNLTNIPLENAYETTLASSISSSDTSITVDTAPQFSLPAGQTVDAVIDPENSLRERVIITAVSGTTLTVTRGAADYLGDSGTAVGHSGGATIVITDSWSVFNDIGTAVNSKINTADGALTAYANAAARDAAITSPANGMQAYLIDTGKFTDYTAGSWVDRESGGTFANASTTVAGKVEIATEAELKAGTGTGGTGAVIAIAPNNAGIKATTTGAGDSGSIVSRDAAGLIGAENLELATDPGLEDSSGLRVKVKTGGGITRDSDGLSASAESVAINAGEAIDGSSTAQAVAIGGSDARSLYNSMATYDYDGLASGNVNMGDVDANTRLGTQITAPNIANATITIKEIYIYVQNTSSPADNTYIELRTDDTSLPDALVTNGTSGNVAGGDMTVGATLQKYTFATPPEVTYNTPYWITWRRSGALDAANYYNWEYDTGAGGTSARYSNIGTSWSSLSSDFMFIVVYQYNFAGNAYKADADNLLYDYVGFTESNVAAGNNIQLQPDGTLTMSGLTAGKEYYLDTTAGAITNAPTYADDTMAVPVGKSLNTTTLKVKSEAPKTVAGNLGVIDFHDTAISTTVTVDLPIQTGFKPNKIRIFAEITDTDANTNASGFIDYVIGGATSTSMAITALSATNKTVTTTTDIDSVADSLANGEATISITEVFDNGFTLRIVQTDTTAEFANVNWIAYS
jgi:hypothetical protein